MAPVSVEAVQKRIQPNGEAKAVQRISSTGADGMYVAIPLPTSQGGDVWAMTKVENDVDGIPVAFLHTEIHSNGHDIKSDMHSVAIPPTNLQEKRVLPDDGNDHLFVEVTARWIDEV